MKLKRFKVVVTLMMMCLLLSNTMGAYAKDDPPKKVLLVGAGLRDITPTVENGILPLTRTSAGNVTSTLGGNLDPLHVRVIALSDGTNKSLFVSFDLSNVPGATVFLPALAKHAGLPKEAIFFTASHAHATVNVPAEIDTSTDYGKRMKRFSDKIMGQMLAAADEALANMQPATVGIGYSESYVNVNRNNPYEEVTKDGDIIKHNYLGYNGSGISEKTVSAVRFDSLKGEPIAFIINYPVHAVVMHNNTIADGNIAISADLPGFVSTNLEKKFDGAVAVWTSGAAGDQNPILMTEMYYPNAETGGFELKNTGWADLLTYLGSIHYRDVMNAVNAITDVTSNVSIKYAYGTTTVPGRSVTVETTDGDSIGKLDKYSYSEGKSFKLGIQVLRIGDIAYAGFPGELFNAHGLYIKENSTIKDMIVVNKVAQSDGVDYRYIPDDYSLEHGGFRALAAGFKPGYVSPSLSILTNKLIDKTNK
ncbi:hypothetical protein RB620_00605 [Paenibacillus sp. LHD-117]|uniref:hypothetical protein n=1 Tax=Paenibacillus sp. LHD-117 TaxID=3071412 RepID=UPI0027E10C0D|nr:hypothetical protein [Paenibacillus sp. LHD-117]MDQ6417924.1 hypothetical protein [Paenibacillus sp. LHD-117]